MLYVCNDILCYEAYICDMLWIQTWFFNKRIRQFEKERQQHTYNVFKTDVVYFD